MARVFVDNFIVLFNGDLDGLQQRYRTSLTGTAESWALELTPRKPPLSRVIERITLRGSGHGIRTMVMLGVDGDLTTTTLESVDTNHRFSDAELETFFSRGVPHSPAAAGR
jgi:outer membrane lipoprotein-sorting protein